MEADLIARGVRIRDIGSERFNWRDLKHVLTNLDHGSATHRAIGGRYSASDYLLVVIANTLRTMSWQLSSGKERDRPEPFFLPDMDDADSRKSTDTYHADVMTIEEMDEWLRGE